MNKILSWMICFLVATSISAQALEVSVKPFYWFPDLDADIRIRKNSIGQRVDFIGDLGLDDDEGIPGVTLGLTLGKSNHFTFSYWWADYNEKFHTLPRTIQYKGVTYPSGSLVSSSLDLDTYETGYAYDLLNFETFKLGPILNVNYYSIDTVINSGSVLNDDSLDLILPFVGLRCAKGFWDNRIELSGQFAGMWWHGSGFWDGAAELSYHPLENLSISAGYRAIHLDVSKDRDVANIKLDGATISATFRY
jgi:hypothetical protein